MAAQTAYDKFAAVRSSLGSTARTEENPSEDYVVQCCSSVCWLVDFNICVFKMVICIHIHSIVVWPTHHPWSSLCLAPSQPVSHYPHNMLFPSKTYSRIYIYVYILGVLSISTSTTRLHSFEFLASAVLRNAKELKVTMREAMEKCPGMQLHQITSYIYIYIYACMFIQMHAYISACVYIYHIISYHKTHI